MWRNPCAVGCGDERLDARRTGAQKILFVARGHPDIGAERCGRPLAFQQSRLDTQDDLPQSRCWEEVRKSVSQAGGRIVWIEVVKITRTIWCTTFGGAHTWIGKTGERWRAYRPSVE